jgi:F0F1-type ATP synthase membrane subunit b/b'
MAQILNDVAGLIVNGLPTFILVLLLTVCVKYLYLQPLDKVLAERYKLTEGARKAAEESLRNADSRISEYETALAQARSGIYQEQSEFLRQVQNEQAAQIATARAAAEARIVEAKAAVAQEAKTAREGLAAQSDALATQIADSILTGRVS